MIPVKTNTWREVLFRQDWADGKRTVPQVMPDWLLAISVFSLFSLGAILPDLVEEGLVEAVRWTWEGSADRCRRGVGVQSTVQRTLVGYRSARDKAG